MNVLVDSAYYLFPPLPVPDETTPREWIEGRGDFDPAYTHLLCLLHHQAGRKREELEAQGYRVNGQSDVLWQPTPVYESRTAMYSADLKRRANSTVPFDGVGDEQVSTFYGWTLAMNLSYE
jgi:hypothetical protein